MQKTNFRFEVLIHDDASTDNTANIIREYEARYPDIIKPIYQKENQYSKGVKIGQTYLYPNAKGKYIAECEGDDYWTDPLKLQKQVEILEMHPEYGCVYTAYETVDIYGNKCKYNEAVRNMRRSFTGDVFRELLNDNFIQTLTCLFRAHLWDTFVAECPFSYDYPLFLNLAVQSQFYYLEDVTGVYRINPVGLVQSGALKRNYNATVVRLCFVKVYLKNWRLRRSHRYWLHVNLWFLLEFSHIYILRGYWKYIKDVINIIPIYYIVVPSLSVINSFMSRFKRI